MELSKTEGEQDACAGDLEDAFFLAEQDKARGLASIIKGLNKSCGFWRGVFNRAEC